MKKIAQIILAVVIVALVYVIYDQISTPIRFEQEMKAKKAHRPHQGHPYCAARVQVEVPALYGQLRYTRIVYPERFSGA